MKSKLRMRISSIFIAVIMLINLLPTTAFAIEPDWSSYTAISSEADLKNIANDMDGKYYLTQDITLTENWTPLGLGQSGSYDKFDGTPFTGTFDGNGHTISGLDTTAQFETYAGVGLFASVGAGGTIRNLTLSDVNVYGRYWVGGFAGLNSGTIENCHLVDSKVAGYEKSNPSQNYNYIGGSQIGGIIGWNLPDGVITDSSVTRSSVLGNLNVGGVTGRNNGTISQSFVRDCSDDHWIGTKYQKSNATYSTALAMVCNSLMMQSQGYNLTTPYMYVGGLVGSNESSQGLGKVSNCYVVNTQLQAIDAFGELIGVNWGDVENCYTAENGISFYSYFYYDWGYQHLNFEPNYTSRNMYKASGSTKNIHYYEGSSVVLRGVGTKHLNGSGMKTQDTYAGWDFENIWTLDAAATTDNYGYPVFGPTTPANPVIDGFTKDRLTTIPDDSDIVWDSSFSEDDVNLETDVVIPQDGSVTLLYKLTVTGDEGANFVITDMGATLAGSNCNATQSGDTISGTIPADGIAEVYVTKTFNADDITEGKLTNSASVEAGADTDLEDGVDGAEDNTSATEENPSIDNFTKERLTSEPTDVTLNLGGVTVDYSDPVVIPQSGSVTLLYKLTVTGDKGANFVVTDNGATLAGSNCGATQSGDTISGTVPAGGSAEVYVTKTFDADDITNGELMNSASIAAGADTDLSSGVGDVEESTSVEEDVSGMPEGPDDNFDYNLVDIEVSCECTNNPECTHDTQTYRVTDGKYTISGRTLNQVKNQWEIYVTVSGTQARSYIDPAEAVWGNPHTGFENVTPPTRLYTLIYNSTDEVWEKDASTAVEFEVTCVHQAEYDLIYDGNAQEDGTTANVPTNSGPHYSGQSVELSKQIPTHSNVNGQKVVFLGWSLSDSNKIYAAGEALPAIVTEVTFADEDITVHAVWGYEDTTNPPSEPSEGELSSLLGNVVEIVCDNTDSNHQATLYNLLSNSYTCAVESMDNGNYRCVVTISPAEYVKQYNLDTGAHHALDPVSQGSKSVILSWNDQNDSWEMPAVASPENQLPFRYTVTCEEISLTYDANGGVFANNSETFVAHNLQQNTAYSLGSESGYTDPTYGTHTFKGWTTDISADGKIYEENETLPLLATTVEIPAVTTVYAVWVEDVDDDDQGGGGGAQHPEAGGNDNDRDDNDDETEEIIEEEVPLAETPWLNTEDHYAYIVGYSEDGTVRPNANITRAEVATIFFRLLTDNARDQFWMTSNNFSDVLPNDWYNNAVSTMVNMGIIQGYEDGTFRPNANITRAEFAAIAARFMASGYEAEDDLFTDIANHWARESINDAAMAGWINGYEDGTFRPDAAITRAEAVTLVNNVLQRKPDADHMLDSMIKWPDNPEGTWYYEAIQEATNSHDYDLFEDAEYETWTALQENRDWAALEKDWANTHLAGGVA